MLLYSKLCVTPSIPIMGTPADANKLHAQSKASGSGETPTESEAAASTGQPAGSPAGASRSGEEGGDGESVQSLSPLGKLIALSPRLESDSLSVQQAPPPTIGQQLNAINQRINDRKRLNEAAAAAARKQRNRAIEELQRRHGATPPSAAGTDGCSNADGSTAYRSLQLPSRDGAISRGLDDERKRPLSRTGGGMPLMDDGEGTITPMKPMAALSSRSGRRSRNGDRDDDDGNQVRRGPGTFYGEQSPQRNAPPGGYSVDNEAFGGPSGTNAPLEDELLSMFSWGEDSDPLGMLYLEPGMIADSNTMASHARGSTRHSLSMENEVRCCARLETRQFTS